MAVSVVQSGQLEYINDDDPIVTFDSALTANNVIALFINSIRVASATVPTGYTSGPVGDASSSFDSLSCWKVATGGETTAQFGSVPSTDDGVIMWAELTGTPSSSPLDGSSEDETNHTTAATTIATDSGSGVTPTGDGGALAFFGADNGLNFEPADNSLDNSFSFLENFAPNTSAFESAAMAFKAFTGTSAQKCTLTTTDNGDQNYGCMLVFKADAGGASSILPFMMAYH